MPLDVEFDPSNRSLKFRESTETPSPKAGVALGVWRFTPSHFPTLPGVPDVTPGLPFGPHPCNPFALVASPKLGLRQLVAVAHVGFVSVDNSLETTWRAKAGTLKLILSCASPIKLGSVALVETLVTQMWKRLIQYLPNLLFGYFLLAFSIIIRATSLLFKCWVYGYCLG
jgi:hypothetical protein